MRTYSLGTKVSIAFAFCLISIFILFISFYRYENELNMRKFKEDHIQSINYFLQLYSSDISYEEISRYFQSFGLESVPNDFTQKLVLQHGNIIYQQSADGIKFSAIIYDSIYYLLVDRDGVQHLLESREKLPSENFFLIIFLSIFALIAWLYVSTIRSIRPIKEFSDTVKRFADGDLSVKFDYKGKDEIGELSNEFNKTAKTIATLYNSRTLFLRTIMHELKTPIGKGRIIAEMVDDETQRTRLIKVFNRLESLINEIAKVEQLVTSKYSVKKKLCKIDDIFDVVFSMLFLEPDQIKKRIHINLGAKPFMMDVDQDMMALVFKNLIDNALKYSSDNHVDVTLKNNTISFINNGAPLEKPIDEYRKAFMTSSVGKGTKSGGMGLGLYIVDNILSMHFLKLGYSYKDGKHRFFINLIKA
jgi:two-component system OmpR family sensor kinase